MKTITVLKSSESAKKLDFDQAKKSDLIEYIFESDEEFYQCWKTGIFEKINKECNKNIDDFETESISTPEELQKCKTILESFPSSKSILKILQLIIEAIDRKTAIYFFF